MGQGGNYYWPHDGWFRSRPWRLGVDKGYRRPDLALGRRGAYAAVIDWVGQTFVWILTTILRPIGAKGYIHLPRRWIVERTFGWFGRYRRLSKDYETKPRSSEAWITIAMIHQMARAMVPNRWDENRLRRRPKRRKC